MERQKEADLSGRVAIVTGSSRGIGKRAALALARRGARLVVTARAVETSGSELPGTIGQTVKEIESLGAEAIAVAADLSKEDDTAGRRRCSRCPARTGCTTTRSTCTRHSP
jgi:NAD(P)-dependent dehydrogenase (short-subunit alcohol dehydrogenase family)